MASTMFYVGIPIVGIMAIAYAIRDCIRMKMGKSPTKMDKETEEFMERFILKLAGVETVILIFVIVTVTLLWRSINEIEPDIFTFMIGADYLIMWIDMVMMSFTFSLTYQVHLSRQQ